MVVGAAVLAFARFPWRRAVAVIALPVAAYLAWFAGVGRLGLSAHSDRFTLGTLSALPRYTWDGLSWALGRASNVQAAGGVLLIGLIVWVVWQAPKMWRRRPVLLALCASTMAFYLLAGLGRDISTGTPDVSRYVYVAIALLTPVIATLLSPGGGPAPVRWGAVAVLTAVLVGNAGQAETWVKARVALTSRLKTDVLAIGRLAANGVPDVTGASAAPISYFPNLSAGGLARLQRSHLLPPAVLTPVDMANARALLALGDWNGANTSLSTAPLVPGHFEYLKSAACVSHVPGPRVLELFTAGGRASVANLAPHAGRGDVGLIPGRDGPGPLRRNQLPGRSTGAQPGTIQFRPRRTRRAS